MKTISSFFFKIISAALFALGVYNCFTVAGESRDLIGRILLYILMVFSGLSALGILLTDLGFSSLLRPSTKMAVLLFASMVNVGSLFVKYLLDISQGGYALLILLFSLAVSLFCAAVFAVRAESGRL